MLASILLQLQSEICHAFRRHEYLRPAGFFTMNGGCLRCLILKLEKCDLCHERFSHRRIGRLGGYLMAALAT